LRPASTAVGVDRQRTTDSRESQLVPARYHISNRVQHRDTAIRVHANACHPTNEVGHIAVRGATADFPDLQEQANVAVVGSVGNSDENLAVGTELRRGPVALSSTATTAPHLITEYEMAVGVHRAEHADSSGPIGRWWWTFVRSIEVVENPGGGESCGSAGRGARRGGETG
jgi:hypothetical protein